MSVSWCRAVSCGSGLSTSLRRTSCVRCTAGATCLSQAASKRSATARASAQGTGQRCAATPITTAAYVGQNHLLPHTLCPVQTNTSHWTQICLTLNLCPPSPPIRLTRRQETTQTLVPPSAPRLPADIALTGAALPTGSSAHVLVAFIQPTSPRSTSSMTYLRARASAWASSTPTPTTAAARTRAATARQVCTDTPAMEAEGVAVAAAAAAVCNRYAVKSDTESC